jgi:glycosyltransferase involved in cell wall biosynthesis/GT2 family glycosyltransferase
MPILELPTGTADLRFAGKRVAIICAGSAVAGNGGAERFYTGLKVGFESLGCYAEFIEVAASEPNVDQIIGNYDLAGHTDLSHFDIVISSKVPTYAVVHPNHVVFLNHAVRIFDDMFDYRFPQPTGDDYRSRARVHMADFKALTQVRARMAQGHEISRRLMRWRGLSAHVLHPPLGFNNFKPSNEEGEYFFIAGRHHPWKRFDLLIRAVKECKRPIRLLIAGHGEDHGRLLALADNDERIQFLGQVSDAELIDLTSRAIAVPFMPLREDFGYVTLEAFASACPVLTCTDAGEPAHIVRNGETGFVVAPAPVEIAAALDWFWDNRREARRMGERGLALIEQMNWRDTAYALAKAACDGLPDPASQQVKVAVLDMQPISPPTGGGRLRLLGLYHGLGARLEAHYIGTYDWPGEKFRDHRLSPSLRETDIPLTDEHFAAAAEVRDRAGGKNVIDLMFSRQAHKSPEYVAAAGKAVEEADIVVFSHPWIYPLVKERLRSNQVVIYDAHNVEGYLRAQMLDDLSLVEREVLEGVISDELECGRRADWVLACSHEDLVRFHRLYGFSPAKIRVVPNGVMAFEHSVPDETARKAARKTLKLEPRAFVGIFIGSAYGPNQDAARFINEELAPACPDVTFVIAGGVGSEMEAAHSNVLITGQIDNEIRLLWYQASDFAINPMMGGSGTNIKMFDFMAMALPVVTTETGARGIETSGSSIFQVAAPTVSAFVSAITDLRNATLRHQMGTAARTCVEEGYAWERISAQLGQFMANRASLAGQSLPKFSVIIPSYERPDRLHELIGALKRQIERDFEVIIVDQSAYPWDGAALDWGFPLFYFHSPVKGAVRARNTGAMLAQGEILAFVDDDCLPEPEWLNNARAWFADEQIAGIEGLIYSDHLDDPDWRPVTNVGFEGIGFMTANLMVRSAAFQYLGGFDLQFDRPHFREDTDFGWRLNGLGPVPYAANVRVFHPAQPRNIERESLAERTRFFKNDAKLYAKHPERYRDLFFRECQFAHNQDFIPTLIEGLRELGYRDETIPEWIRDKHPERIKTR